MKWKSQNKKKQEKRAIQANRLKVYRHRDTSLLNTIYFYDLSSFILCKLADFCPNHNLFLKKEKKQIKQTNEMKRKKIK